MAENDHLENQVRIYVAMVKGIDGELNKGVAAGVKSHVWKEPKGRIPATIEVGSRGWRRVFMACGKKNTNITPAWSRLENIGREQA